MLIDDSQSFLDSLAFQMNPILACKLFSDPREALVWLRQPQQSATNGLIEPIRVGYDEEIISTERRSASIDTARIYRMVTDPHRFDIPAVLVVDFSMPQMDGVEFCTAIQDLPCKKILLTGYVDDKIVIEAFNRKLIDCFIHKGDPKATIKLESEIFRLQNEYFLERSSTLKDLLSRHSYSFLTDPAIVDLVAQLKSSHQYVEHYLFPDPAGILLVDMQGKAYVMVVATEESLITQYEVALDQEAPSELLDALQEFRLVPFFYDTGGTYLTELGDDWRQYCQPPQACLGRQNYFWTLFDLPPHFLQEPVYSYDAFLQKWDEM